MVMRTVSFKLDDFTLWLLEEYARRRGLTKSEVIRRALMAYLNTAPELKPYVTSRMRIYG